VTAAPSDLPQTIPYEQTFDGLYGLEVLEMGKNRATARVPVLAALILGVCHHNI